MSVAPNNLQIDGQMQRAGEAVPSTVFAGCEASRKERNESLSS